MKKILVSLATALVITLTSVAAPLTEASAYVEYRVGTHEVSARSGLNVRSSPVNGSVLDVLDCNEVVEIVEVKNNWGRLRTGGWVCLDYTNCVSHFADLDIDAPSMVNADDDHRAIIELTFSGIGIAKLGAKSNRAVKGQWNAINWKQYPQTCSARLDLSDLQDGATEIYLNLIGDDGTVIFSRTVIVYSGDYVSEPTAAEKYRSNVPDIAKQHIGNTYTAYLDEEDQWCGYAAREIALEALTASGFSSTEAKNSIGWKYLTGACTAAWAYEHEDIGSIFTFLPWSIEEEYYSGAAQRRIHPSGSPDTSAKSFSLQVGDFILTETNYWLGDGPDHVALITSVSDDGSTFTTVEGNTGSGTAATRKVQYHKYERVTIKIDGQKYETYRRTDTSGILCAVTTILRPAIN